LHSKHTECGRLACTVWSKESYDGPFLDSEREIFHRNKVFASSSVDLVELVGDDWPVSSILLRNQAFDFSCVVLDIIESLELWLLDLAISLVRFVSEPLAPAKLDQDGQAEEDKSLDETNEDAKF